MAPDQYVTRTTRVRNLLRSSGRPWKTAGHTRSHPLVIPPGTGTCDRLTAMAAIAGCQGQPGAHMIENQLSSWLAPIGLRSFMRTRHCPALGDSRCCWRAIRHGKPRSTTWHRDAVDLRSRPLTTHWAPSSMLSMRFDSRLPLRVLRFSFPALGGGCRYPLPGW